MQLQQLEGILPKALANSERVTPELPLDEGKEDTKTAKPLVQLGALQLLVSRSEALARNEQLVSAIVHGGPASLEALLAASPDVQVRSLGYDLLAALHDVYFPTSHSKNEHLTAQRVRAALIRGLGDQDGEGMLDAPKDEAIVEEDEPPPPVQETPDEDVVMLETNPNPPPPPEVRISASRCEETPSRHRCDSCPSHDTVAGLFFSIMSRCGPRRATATIRAGDRRRRGEEGRSGTEEGRS